MKPAEKILEELDQRDLREPAKKVAAEHRMTVEELLSDSRVREATAARRAFWLLLKTDYAFTNGRIARLVGTDPATVRMGVKIAERSQSAKGGAT